MTARLPDDTHIASAHLLTADLPRALRFYSDLLGFRIMRQDAHGATLSADGCTPHLLLSARPDARPKPRRSVGLYHVAIRFPNRRALAHVFRRMLAARYPFSGFSDHGVSEALYLDDPDGNGLELYTDRPRSVWPRAGQHLRMTTQPLDLDDLLAAADDAPWTGIDPQTDIGHLHLHVSDLGAARRIYSDLLGLDVMQDMGYHGAIFLAAGGYHHHLGLNIWGGAAPQPPGTLGLRSFALRIPDRAARQAAIDRLRAGGVTVDEQDGRAMMRDVDGNVMELVSEDVD